MQDPFAALGLPSDANAAQVRAAYHSKVKQCHPDSVQGTAEQQAAQDKLIRLNLQYKEAMQTIASRGAANVVLPDPRLVAQKLYEQGHLDGALRVLVKAAGRDAGWFVLQGEILLKKGEPEAAHQSFRTAIRLEPENARLREMALAASVAAQKQKTLRGRVGCWARGVMARVL